MIFNYSTHSIAITHFRISNWKRWLSIHFFSAWPIILFYIWRRNHSVVLISIRSLHLLVLGLISNTLFLRISISLVYYFVVSSNKLSLACFSIRVIIFVITSLILTNNRVLSLNFFCYSSSDLSVIFINPRNIRDIRDWRSKFIILSIAAELTITLFWREWFIRNLNSVIMLNITSHI